MLCHQITTLSSKVLARHRNEVSPLDTEYNIDRRREIRDSSVVPHLSLSTPLITSILYIFDYVYHISLKT